MPILPKLICQCNAVSIRISTDIQSVPISSACTHTPLYNQTSLKKALSSKIKSWRTLRWCQQSIKPSAVPSEHGPCVPAQMPLLREADPAILPTTCKTETFPWKLFFLSLSWCFSPKSTYHLLVWNLLINCNDRLLLLECKLNIWELAHWCIPCA